MITVQNYNNSVLTIIENVNIVKNKFTTIYKFKIGNISIDIQ